MLNEPIREIVTRSARRISRPSSSVCTRWPVCGSSDMGQSRLQLCTRPPAEVSGDGKSVQVSDGLAGHLRPTDTEVD